VNHDLFHDYYGTPCCSDRLHAFPRDRLFFGFLFGILFGFPSGFVLATLLFQ